MSRNNVELLPVDQVVPSIFIMRGRFVLLDSDLAAFNGIPTSHFHGQLKRNGVRIPTEFMFQLSAEEVRTLAAQCVRSDPCEHAAPYALTEHGVLMAAMVLNTPRAMDTGAQVVRAFVQMRGEVSQLLDSNGGLALSILQLDQRIQSHDLILAILQTFCDIMKAPDALHLTEAQQAELDRLLEEYERSQGGGTPWPGKGRILKRG